MNPPIRCKKLYLNILAEGSDIKIGKTLYLVYTLHPNCSVILLHLEILSL